MLTDTPLPVDLAQRMEALVRQVAQCRYADDESAGFGVGSLHINEARALVAKLPKPFDPDMLAARKLAIDNIKSMDDAGMTKRYVAEIEAGEHDDSRKVGVKLSYDAIKVGRELARAGDA